MMSVMPLPRKSPTWTSTQVTLGFQLVQSEVVKLLPFEMPTHQLPVCKSRAAISVRPLPLKSPVRTSTQVTLGFQGPQGISECIGAIGRTCPPLASLRYATDDCGVPLQHFRGAR